MFAWLLFQYGAENCKKGLFASHGLSSFRGITFEIMVIYDHSPLTLYALLIWLKSRCIIQWKSKSRCTFYSDERSSAFEQQGMALDDKSVLNSINRLWSYSLDSIQLIYTYFSDVEFKKGKFTFNKCVMAKGAKASELATVTRVELLSIREWNIIT